MSQKQVKQGTPVLTAVDALDELHEVVRRYIFVPALDAERVERDRVCDVRKGDQRRIISPRLRERSGEVSHEGTMRIDDSHTVTGLHQLAGEVREERRLAGSARSNDQRVSR